MLSQGIEALTTGHVPVQITPATPVLVLVLSGLSFPSYSLTDIFYNPIGNFVQNATVAQIEQIDILSRLLALMLQIAPPPEPQPSNFDSSFNTIMNFNLSVDVQTQLTPNVRHDRGVLSPVPSDGSQPQYRPATSVTSYSDCSVITTLPPPTQQQLRRVKPYFALNVSIPAKLRTGIVAAAISHAVGNATIDGTGSQFSPVPRGVLNTPVIVSLCGRD